MFKQELWEKCQKAIFGCAVKGNIHLDFEIYKMNTIYNKYNTLRHIMHVLLYIMYILIWINEQNWIYDLCTPPVVLYILYMYIIDWTWFYVYIPCHILYCTYYIFINKCTWFWVYPWLMLYCTSCICICINVPDFEY